MNNQKRKAYPVSHATYRSISCALDKASNDLAYLQRIMWMLNGMDDNAYKTWGNVGRWKISCPHKTSHGWMVVDYELSSFEDYNDFMTEFENAKRDLKDFFKDI